MKKSLLMLIMLLSVCSYAQNKDIVNKHFILSLINEGILIVENTEKGDDLGKIQLELDAIGNYFEDIYFYRFTIGKNKIISDENIKISLNASSCETYILAFSFEVDTKYRLKGFHGNDLLFLLRDIKMTTGYRKNYDEILLELNLFIDDIDFEEVYKAIMTLDFDSPSLKNCREGKKAHGKTKE